MAKRSTSGSSVVINNEIHFKGEKTEIRGSGENCTPVKRSEIAEPVNTGDFVQMLLGSMPACAEGQSMSQQEMQMLGGIAAAGMIEVTQNPQTANMELNYALSLLKVVDGAYAKKGVLNEEELKRLIASSLSQMLENAVPACTNWNEVLADAMRQETMTGFLKGIQPAICAVTGDPVNAGTGNFIYEKEDLRINGRIPLCFKRSYNSIDTRTGCMGKGWRHNYEIQLITQEDRYVVLWEDGREELYMRGEGNTPVPLFGGFCRLKKNGEGFLYETQEKVFYTFDSKGKLLKQEDLNGWGLQFTYNKQGYLGSVSNKYGASINYQYDSSSGMLTAAADHSGRSVTLIYELGRLKEVKNAAGVSYSYSYDSKNNIHQVRNPRRVGVLENKYDDRGRIISQLFADGGRTAYDYQKDSDRTLVTEPNGNKVAYVHDEKFRNVKTVYIDGEETFSYNDRNHLVARTDKKGNKTKFFFDDRGNTTQIIYPDGAKKDMTYDADNRLLVLSVNGIVQQTHTYDNKGNLIQTADALGRIHAIEYDENGRAVKLIQPDGSNIQFIYDGKGNITQITDGAGSSTIYEYDNCNRVIKKTNGNGNGNSTRFSYNESNKITRITNAAGYNRTYEYTKNGKLNRVIDFDGSVTAREYNNMNQVKSVTLPDGETTSIEYDLMQNITRKALPGGAEIIYAYDDLNRMEQMTFPMGGTVKYEYDPNGNRTSVVDPDGNRNIMAYDECNRLIMHTDAAGAATKYEYDMEGRIISITNAAGKAHSCCYDEAGQLISETDVLGNTTHYEYNALGRPVSVTDPEKRKTLYEYTSGGYLSKAVYPDGLSETYSYDKNGNLVCCRNHKGDLLNFSYDCLERLIMVSSSFGQKKSYTYNAAGKVASLTDAQGHITHYEYSQGGKMTSVVDAAGNRTEYAYDAMGDLIMICQHEGDAVLLKGNGQKAAMIPNSDSRNHVTRYERNLLGKIDTVTDPLGQQEHYTYDPAGRLILKKDKEGYETQYAYNPVGNIEKVTYADGRSAAFTYNCLRQLTGIRDWLGTTSIEPDEKGRIKRLTDYKGRKISYELGNMGQRETMVYPDGRKVTYEYDEWCRLSRLEDGKKEVTYYYDDDGRLSKKVLPEGLVSSYHYNAMGFLDKLIHQKNEEILENYEYEYDLSGNKTAIRKNRRSALALPAVSEQSESQLQEENGFYQYRYDKLNRLTEVRKNRERLSLYEYDAFGNRIRKQTGEKNTSYHYNAANRLISRDGNFTAEFYQYDARGNLTSVLSGGKISNRYVYDETNCLTAALNGRGQAALYQYDGLGNRVGAQEYALKEQAPDSFINQEQLAAEKPDKEVDYLLDLTKRYNNLIGMAERSDEKTKVQSYIWDIKAVFMTEGEKSHIYLQDELGSTIRLIGTEENQQTIYGYDEYGQDLYGTQGVRQPFGYTGYRRDGIANTYFAQAREYFSELGKFGGEDKDKGSIQLPPTLNGFQYCYNNPLKYIDMDGHKPSDPLDEWTKKNLGAALSTQEKLLSVLNPDDAIIVKYCADTADAWTDKVFSAYYQDGTWQDGDAANAYRHAMWNALLKGSFMSDAKAKMWADAHEAWPEDELANSEWNGFTGLEHTNMDYFNNAIGRESLKLYELNTTQPEISDRILEKLKKGEMVYLVDDKRYDKLLECESAE